MLIILKLTGAAVDGTPSQMPSFLLLPWGQGHINVAQCPLHQVTYAPAKLLPVCPTVKEEMHLHENTLYDLHLGFKVT